MNPKIDRLALLERYLREDKDYHALDAHLLDSHESSIGRLEGAFQYWIDRPGSLKVRRTPGIPLSPLLSRAAQSDVARGIEIYEPSQETHLFRWMLGESELGPMIRFLNLTGWGMSQSVKDLVSDIRDPELQKEYLIQLF